MAEPAGDVAALSAACQRGDHARCPDACHENDSVSEEES